MLFYHSHQISLPCKYPPLSHPCAMGRMVHSFWLCSTSKAKYQTVWEVLNYVHPTILAVFFNVL